MTTIRTLLAIAASESWLLFQIDVKKLFLMGIQGRSLHAYTLGGYSFFKNHVCQLQHSLSGPKQAPRIWFDKLSTTLPDKDTYVDRIISLVEGFLDQFEDSKRAG